MNKKFAFISAVFVLTGCSSMSGYDAKNDFACRAPEGILCESMTGIYANAKENNLPGQRVNRKAGRESDEVSRAKDGETGVMTKAIQSGTPSRSAPKIVRVWLSPWEDSDGDLHDQSYIYLPVDSGRWLIEHNRRRIQESYRPVRAPVFQQNGKETQRSESGQQPVVPMGMVGTGSLQERPSPDQAAQIMNGLLKPRDVMPMNENE